MHFGWTYFRDIYSGINEKWYNYSWKEFIQWKYIDQKYYCSNFYDVSVNKYDVTCRTSSTFCENKGWINEIDPYGWFQWYFRYCLGRRSLDVERQINRWKRIKSRFKGKFFKMIKDKKWVDKKIKMSYYQFNRQEILQKAKERYSKEKAVEYYLKNK